MKKVIILLAAIAMVGAFTATAIADVKLYGSARMWTYTIEHSKDVEQCGFAGAGGTHDGHELPFFHVERDSTQNVASSGSRLVELLEIMQLDHVPSPKAGSGLPVYSR